MYNVCCTPSSHPPLPPVFGAIRREGRENEEEKKEKMNEDERGGEGVIEIIILFSSSLKVSPFQSEIC